MKVEKVTLNIGAGEAGTKLDKAYKLLEKLSGQKPVRTRAKKKIPQWGIKIGGPIGCKVTLRKEKAVNFLKKALEALGNELKESNFDQHGNLSFGIEEYIDLPGVKYDPTIGILGLGVQVTLEKPGYRIKKRKLRKKKVPKSYRIKKAEAIEFMKKEFGVEVK